MDKIQIPSVFEIKTITYVARLEKRLEAINYKLLSLENQLNSLLDQVNKI